MEACGKRQHLHFLCHLGDPAGASLGEGSDGNPLLTATTSSELKPEETTNYEIGTKWDLLDQRLALTAAVFRTEKENARVLVSSNTYENVGKSRVDGLELTATGKLTNNWQVFAGYTYMDAKLVDGGKQNVGVYSSTARTTTTRCRTPRITA